MDRNTCPIRFVTPVFCLDLDYLVLNDLSHYSNSVLEEVNHNPFNMIVANIFPFEVDRTPIWFHKNNIDFS